MMSTMPVTEFQHHKAPYVSQTTNAQSSTSNTGSNSNTNSLCDCAEYRSKGLACPCSIEYASKTGKRAVERLFHKSVFFVAPNILANVELQTEAEAATGAWRNMTANKVVQVNALHVQVGRLLGQGGFCLVHDVTITLPEQRQSNGKSNNDGDNNSSTSQDYCVKFLKPSILTERRKFARGIADLAIEAHFLATLNHPHILKIRGVTEGIELFQATSPQLTNQPGIDGGYFLLLDKVHMTLDRKIEVTWKSATEKYNSFLWRTTHDLRGVKRRGVKTERLDVALQLAQAMQYLHQHNIVYRDLKPDNIGFDQEDNLKLFDFGLAKELKPYKKHEDGTYHLTANTGSRRYMAPEVALRKRYNLSVDVFSYAILVWEICSLEKPFDGYSEVQHMSFVVQRGFRPKLDTLKNWPDGLRAMIASCWDQDMNRRPTFRDVVGAVLEIKKGYINGD